MKYDPKIHHRRSIRLKNYDYSKNGAYFITICTQDHKCIFGQIENDTMNRNPAGEMIQKWWLEMPNKFTNFELDSFVVMPNHFHAIIVIDNENVGVPLVGTQKPSQIEQPKIGPPQTGQAQGIAPTGKTIGDFIGAFKSLTTNEYIRRVKTGEFLPFEKRIWQRNYHEHIIRNESSYEKIRYYIEHNPENWNTDKFFSV